MPVNLNPELIIMNAKKILIANRGEIAIRIARAGADLGIATVAIYSEDDEQSLHTKIADEARKLVGAGAAAYLNGPAVIAVAKETGCDAIHPGYGFLAESGDFARQCADAGILFIGPSVEHLELFGDKAKARGAAIAANVPVNRGLDRAITLEEARTFFDELGPGGAIIIKAVAGGGGRGTRAVTSAEELASAYARCRSEAKTAFGRDEVYIEEFLTRARHVEVQILGDLEGGVIHLGERECSIQRRFQKIIEIAPAPDLDDELRRQVIDAAMRFATSVGYSNLGTFEFLIDTSGRAGAPPFVFIETNARLQVEHTVTEAVTGVDLVQSQIRLAYGDSLAAIGLDDPAIAAPRGYAIQARINMETFAPDGSVRPGGGTITAYDPPSGPGVRTDGFGYAGYRINDAFDSLLAKVICHSPSRNFSDALVRCRRALSEFRLDGVAVNTGFLLNVLAHKDFAVCNIHTRWIDENVVDLASSSRDERQRFIVAEVAKSPGIAADGYAGARIDSSDPLALFTHDAKVKATQKVSVVEEEVNSMRGPEGSTGLLAPIQGTLVSIDVSAGDTVHMGQQLAVLEAMKMEHIVTATSGGIVREITMAQGDIVRENYPIMFIEQTDADGEADASQTDNAIDPNYIRPDLQEALARRALTLDENRPEAVAKHKARGYRMLRENIAELVDPDSLQEYWPLVVAKQHQRHDMETLRKNTPADGVVAGTASINGEFFDDVKSRAVVVGYDYTVLAGTQGQRNHYKQDRMYELAQRFKLPLVLFSGGGGGRPGDDNTGPRVAVDTNTFTTFSQLSGLVPLVGVNVGRCFAGNTALLACCDVIIATEGSTIAMGGPAMIEGGGLGVYTPEEVGPMSTQVPNGVVDILVKDETSAVETAKKYLSYFQGPLDKWEAADQRTLRHVVPENRVRLYDMREIISTIADKNSVLEIREKFGVGVITAFIRIEGKPMGLIANNPHHLAGAIDSDGADKGARFLQLCDAFDIPVLSLMDCPGIMVGPEVEQTALVRHSTRMFNTGANMTTPLLGVIIRKAYGLGIQAMCGASTLVGFFTIAWPTAEFAGMNIEGAVKLGHRNELTAIEDPIERKAEFDRRVSEAYETARAVNAGTGGGIDDVIDPAETRTWIANSLKRLPPIPLREGKKYPFISPW
jgi:acetyl/propionyl-CoA carboxylase alpha subunit/acetyl-CoA carboxylase carboxyltransferase component